MDSQQEVGLQSGRIKEKTKRITLVIKILHFAQVSRSLEHEIHY
jgi:hypothetical protein